MAKLLAKYITVNIVVYDIDLYMYSMSNINHINLGAENTWSFYRVSEIIGREF